MANPFAPPGANFRESAIRREEAEQAERRGEAGLQEAQRLKLAQRKREALRHKAATAAAVRQEDEAAARKAKRPAPPPAAGAQDSSTSATTISSPAGAQNKGEPSSGELPMSSKDIGDLPEAPPKWAPNSSTETCFSCSSRFDWKRRRHHCRACGQVFCNACTLERMMLPSDWKIREPQRVCEHCAVLLRSAQQNLVSTNANATRVNKINTSSALRYVNRPVNFTLGGEVRKSAMALHNIMNGVETVIEDHSIVEDLLRDAQAIMFITIMKVAFIGGVRAGTGLIVTRTNNAVGWSAPCAIGSFGLSVGAEVGVETTDMIIPIRRKSDIALFTKGTGHMRFGGEAGLAFGPLGRSACAEAAMSTNGASKAVGYAHSRGIYGGVSLEGAYCRVRHDVNMAFYGHKVSSADILSDKISPPTAAQPLYDSLRAYKTWVLGKPAEGAGVETEAGSAEGKQASGQGPTTHHRQQEAPAPGDVAV